MGVVIYLVIGRSMFYSFLFTTLNQFGRTVISNGVIMTRSRELGLDVWERCDDLNNETDLGVTYMFRLKEMKLIL